MRCARGRFAAARDVGAWCTCTLLQCQRHTRGDQCVCRGGARDAHAGEVRRHGMSVPGAPALYFSVRGTQGVINACAGEVREMRAREKCGGTGCWCLLHMQFTSVSEAHKGLSTRACAGEVREMRAREKRDGTEVDWAVEAVMKACALEGKRESLATDIVLRLLDLEVGNYGFLKLLGIRVLVTLKINSVLDKTEGAPKGAWPQRTMPT